MMTAAINYCHGFAQGAVLVEEAHEGHRDVSKLFCLPSPPPPRTVPSTEPTEAEAKKPPSIAPRMRWGKCVATIAAPTEP